MLRLNYDKRDIGFSFGIAVAMMVVASLFVTLIFGDATEGWRFWLKQGLYTLAIGSSAFIYAAIVRVNPVTASRLNVKPSFAHMGWGILATTCLIFAILPINYMLMDAIEAIGLPAPDVKIPHGIADLPGLVIVAAVLPAFCEEMVFRGTIARAAENMNNKLAALALCGGLFAVYHANPAQTIHQFILGGLLTLLALRSGSVWTSVVVHLFNNLFVVGTNFTVLGQESFWSVRDNTAVVLPIMFAGFVGFALCMFGYLKTTRSAWAEPSERKTHAQDGTSLFVLCVSVGVCLVLWFTTLFSGA